MLPWRKVIPDAGTRRTSSAAWYYDRKLWFFGGKSTMFPLRTPRFRNDLLCFDLETECWYSMDCQGDMPSPRVGSSATVLDHGRVLLFGGSAGCQSYDDLYILHLNSDSDDPIWERVATSGACRPAARFGHAAARLSNSDRVLIHGGTGLATQTPPTACTLDDLWLLDTKIWQWTKIKITCPPLQNHTAVTVENFVYFYGGMFFSTMCRKFQCSGKMFRYRDPFGTPDTLRDFSLKAISKFSEEEKRTVASLKLPNNREGTILKMICHPKNIKIDKDIGNFESATTLLNF